MNEIEESTQLKIRNLHNIENKLRRYNHHKDFLHNYKTNRKYPKGLSLKFNLSLYPESDELQKLCRNILRNASFQLRDVIIKAVNKKIENLKIIRNACINEVKNNTSMNDFNVIYENIEKEKAKLSNRILKRHESKYVQIKTQ